MHCRDEPQRVRGGRGAFEPVAHDQVPRGNSLHRAPTGIAATTQIGSSRQSASARSAAGDALRQALSDLAQISAHELHTRRCKRLRIKDFPSAPSSAPRTAFYSLISINALDKSGGPARRARHPMRAGALTPRHCGTTWRRVGCDRCRRECGAAPCNVPHGPAPLVDRCVEERRTARPRRQVRASTVSHERGAARHRHSQRRATRRPRASFVLSPARRH